jgi:hypothetical protein
MYIQNIESLKDTLITLQSDDQIKALLLFGSDKNRPSVEVLQEALNINQKPLIGGIFPEIIANGVRKEVGFVLVPLYEMLEVTLFESKGGDGDATFNTRIESWLSSTAEGIESVFCFVNALWQQKTAFMNVLYDELGPFVHYLGGGAGSLSFQSFPCVFANQTIAEHAAAVGVTRNPMSVGVAHGWHPITELIKVTETKGNTVVSLNWQPAFEVYKMQVEAHARQSIREDNFFDIAKSYPLGLVRLDNEMIIRDPYATENGMLHIVDEVLEGEYIRIMHGNMSSLLEGAKNAVAKSENYDAQEHTQLCIDCISRVLFMQNNFTEELEYLNKNQKANGVLSIGEIANPNNTALELFNKTVVVAQWKKKN